MPFSVARRRQTQAMHREDSSPTNKQRGIICAFASRANLQPCPTRLHIARLPETQEAVVQVFDGKRNQTIVQIHVHSVPARLLENEGFDTATTVETSGAGPFLLADPLPIQQEQKKLGTPRHNKLIHVCNTVKAGGLIQR
jgi:hypothetical protein